MTVTPTVRTAMTSPTVPQHLQQQQKTSRVSNFSVASLLADTRPPQQTQIHTTPTNNNKNSNSSLTNTQQNVQQQTQTTTTIIPTSPSATSPPPTTIVDLAPTNLSQSSASPISHHDNSSNCTKNERHTPQSSTESDIDYDSNQDEDSIVDIEDVRNENSSTPPTDSDRSAQQMLGAHAAAIAGPIRPTPTCNFNALVNSLYGMPWALGSRQMAPFAQPNLFPGQGFGPGHAGGGKSLKPSTPFLLQFATPVSR